MATKNISQRIEFEGAEQFKQQLTDIGKAGERVAAQLKGALDQRSTGTGFISAIANIKNQFTALRTAAAPIGTAFTGLTTSIGKFESAVVSSAKRVTFLTAALTGAAAGAALLLKASGKAAESTIEQADTFGFTVEQIQRVNEALTVSGADAGLLDRVLLHFNQTADATASTTKTAADNFDAWAKTIKTVGGGTSQLVDSTINVVRGVGQVGQATRASFGDLESYAAHIESITDRHKRLELLSKEFGSKLAPAVDKLFRSLTNGARSAVKPLDDLTENTLANMDDAFDTFGISLQRTRDNLSSVVAPIVTVGLNTLEKLLADNQDKLLAFAAAIRDRVVPIVQDLFHALAGEDSQVQNKGIIQLRDQIIQFANDAKTAITNIVIPAINGIIAALDFVAQKINDTFGTNFSGREFFIAAIITRLIGGFRLLGSAILVAWRAGVVLKTILPGIGIAFQGLLFIIGRAATALAVFAIGNPIVAGIIAAAAALAFLATRQTENQKAADAHTAALQKLDEARAQVQAGIPGAVDAFKTLSAQELQTAKDALASAEQQVAAQKAILAALPQPGENFGKGQFLARAQAIKDLDSALGDLSRRRGELDGIQKSIADTGTTAKNTATDVNQVSAATSSLAANARRAADGFKSIAANVRHVPGASGGLLPDASNVAADAGKAQASIDKLSTAFDSILGKSQDAAGGIRSNWAGLDELFTKLFDVVSRAGTKALDDLANGFNALQVSAVGLGTVIASDFADGINGIPASFQKVIDQIKEATKNLPDALHGLFDDAGNKIVDSWHLTIQKMADEIQSLVDLTQSVANRITTIINTITSQVASVKLPQAAADQSVPQPGLSAPTPSAPDIDIAKPFRDAQAEIARIATSIAQSAAAIADSLVAPVRKADSDLQGLLAGIVARITAAINSIATAAPSPVQGSGLANSLTAPFNQARSAIEGIWNGLAQMLDSGMRELAGKVDALAVQIKQSIAGIQASLAGGITAPQTAPGAGLSAGQTPAPQAGGGGEGLLSGWQQLLASITGIFKHIETGAQTLWSNLGQIFEQGGAGLAKALDGITAGFSAAVAGLPAAWERILAQLVAAAQGAGGQLAGPFQTAAGTIEGAFTGIVGTVSSQLQALVGVAQQVAAQIGAVLASIEASIARVRAEAAQAAATVPGSERFAAGGPVRGRGTGTSDSILAWVSNGEYIVRAAMAAKFRPLLEAINSGRLDFAQLLKRVQGLKAGGPTVVVKPFADLSRLIDAMMRPPELARAASVQRAPPHFARGGPVWAGRPVANFARGGSVTVKPLIDLGRILDALPHFDVGGIVDDMSSRLGSMSHTPALAGIGSVAVIERAAAKTKPMTPINLNIDRQTFVLMADNQVAGAMVNYATGKNLRSAGKPPMSG